MIDMVIASTGLVRLALLLTSTWTFHDVGTGVTTVNISDTDLESTFTTRHTINIASASAFTAYMKIVYTKSEGNPTTASNITEMAVYDASVFGNILFRTVASTLTWTSFAKTSTIALILSTALAVTAG